MKRWYCTNFNVIINMAKSIVSVTNTFNNIKVHRTNSISLRSTCVKFLHKLSSFSLLFLIQQHMFNIKTDLDSFQNIEYFVKDRINIYCISYLLIKSIIIMFLCSRKSTESHSRLHSRSIWNISLHVYFCYCYITGVWVVHVRSH